MNVSYESFISGLCDESTKEKITNIKNDYISRAKELDFDLPEKTAIELALKDYNEGKYN